MADDIATAAPGQQATDISNADVTTMDGEDHGTGDSHQHGDTLGEPKTNGNVHSIDSQMESPDPSVTAKKEAAEGGEPAAGQTSPVKAGINGTPASSKKISSGSTKKKSAGVPEHKTKKLNRKKSRPTLRLDAKPGELYLARMKGHPPWPSIICDEEMLPPRLVKHRPVTTAQPDGTYKKPEYADGGKRAYERTFPIMFLKTNEFAWIPNTDLTPLTPEECKDAPEKGKPKHLIDAYKIAAEGHDLAYFKGVLSEHDAVLQEEAEARAERDALKAKKAKRKSVEVSAIAADEDEDAMDVDSTAVESKLKSKKRKKSPEGEDVDEKPAKTPKTATKLKLTTPKTPTVETSGKKKASKPKSLTKKTATKTNGSEDDIIDTPKVEEKPLTPAEAKDKKEKEIRYYRHKLQKGFLSRDTVPAEEEIKSLAGFLSKLETYPDLEGSIIRATKIHKVLKAMIRLSSIPKDEEYQFKKRSHELLTKWNKILQDDPTPGGDKDDDGKLEDANAINGVTKIAKDQQPVAEAGESAGDDEGAKNGTDLLMATVAEGENEATTGYAEQATTNAQDEPDVEKISEESADVPEVTA